MIRLSVKRASVILNCRTRSDRMFNYQCISPLSYDFLNTDKRSREAFTTLLVALMYVLRSVNLAVFVGVDKCIHMLGDTVNTIQIIV